MVAAGLQCGANPQQSMPIPLQPHAVAADQNGSGFLLNLAGRLFGFLYVTPSSYTLACSGIINFARIETEAAICLALSLHDISAWRYRTTVSMIFRVEPEWDELIEFNLDDPVYSEALKHPDSILFARYDFQDPAGTELSFIAQNAQHFGSDAEFSVIMPKSLPLTPQFLNWLASRHSDSITHHLDRDTSAHILNQLVRPETRDQLVSAPEVAVV